MKVQNVSIMVQRIECKKWCPDLKAGFYVQSSQSHIRSTTNVPLLWHDTSVYASKKFITYFENSYIICYLLSPIDFSCYYFFPDFLLPLRTFVSDYFSLDILACIFQSLNLICHFSHRGHTFHFEILSDNWGHKTWLSEKHRTFHL